MKFCLLALVASTAAFMTNDKATIQRHYSKKDLLIQREAAGVPIREIFEELKSRTKRTAGVPDFSRSVLNDDHPVAQIKYSGQINSEVRKSRKDLSKLSPCIISIALVLYCQLIE